MSTMLVNYCDEAEMRIVRKTESVIDADTFFKLNENDDYELVNGIMEKRMAAGWEHEQLNIWLMWLMTGFAEENASGSVSGSRTTVHIDEFNGRLPDLLFVRNDRLAIIQEDGIHGPPDLVIELVSPTDRPSGILAVETHYRTLGVPEIVFIDQRRQSVRLLRRRGNSYEENVLTAGEMAFETLPGFVLQVEWLFADQRPSKLALLNQMLGIG